MRIAIAASAFVLAVSGTAFAETGEKLAQAECDALWMEASPSGGKLSKSAAMNYVTDFQAANPDGDDTLEQDEFRNACEKGWIKSSAAQGAGAGTSGME